MFLKLVLTLQLFHTTCTKQAILTYNFLICLILFIFGGQPKKELILFIFIFN